MNPVLARLLAQRQEQIDFISHLLEQVETENRDLVDAERSNVDAARQRIEQLDAQIAPLEAFEATRTAHNETAGTVAPTAPRGRGDRQPLTAQDRQHKYESAGEFIVDYLRARGQSVQGGTMIAPDPDAGQRVQSALGRSLTGDERAIAHQTTADTPGLLPKNIIGEILTDLDEARPFVTSVGAKPLGSVTGKTFSRPYVSQHTQVGEQSAEKADLPSRQLKIDGIDFAKKTFGGALNVSRQEIDWTSPSAWNAIIDDLQVVYGEYTEDWAAGVMVAGVTQSINITAAHSTKLDFWIDALYDAAVMAATANGTKRGRAGRLSNVIYASLDMWGALGKVLDKAKTTATNPAGASTPTGFAGNILDINRVVVPGLPAGSFVVGRTNLFEFYEERIGLLSAVEPKVLGIEIAYGGYAAAGFLDATAFTKVTVGSAG